MIPRSAISQVPWPALPGPDGALMLAMQQQLRESERLPPQQLEQRQLDALGRVLRHAWETVPFYRDDPSYGIVANGSSPTRQAWESLPLLTRAQIQEAGTALTSNSVPADHQPLIETFTSGSTGRPIRGVGTRVTSTLWLAFTLREQLWHGRDLSGKFAAIRADSADKVPSEGATLAGWGPAVDKVYPTGPGVLFSVHRDVAAQVEWLCQQNPDYLVSLPSNLVALAEHFNATGARLPRLRQACSYGEAISPDVRAACRAAWGVGLIDIYSTRELGYLALQCPRGDQYHVQSENVYLEVLDQRGHPCRPGEIGRVVVSTMHNYAMPLLRYDLGDYAQVGEPCPCGRSLPVLTRIMGRQRNMLLLPTGERVWPRLRSRHWAHIGEIRQLQLVQQEVDRIEARLVARRPLTASEESQFTSTLHQSLAYPFRVSFSYLDSIDRSQTLKFEEFVSLLDT